MLAKRHPLLRNLLTPEFVVNADEAQQESVAVKSWEVFQKVANMDTQVMPNPNTTPLISIRVLQGA